VRVKSKPPSSAPIGNCVVERKRTRSVEATRYDLALLELKPLRMSCNCADFLRSTRTTAE
jgi:hypothetical protein